MRRHGTLPSPETFARHLPAMDDVAPTLPASPSCHPFLFGPVPTILGSRALLSKQGLPPGDVLHVALQSASLASLFELSVAGCTSCLLLLLCTWCRPSGLPPFAGWVPGGMPPLSRGPTLLGTQSVPMYLAPCCWQRLRRPAIASLPGSAPHMRSLPSCFLPCHVHSSTAPSPYSALSAPLSCTQPDPGLRRLVTYCFGSLFPV